MLARRKSELGPATLFMPHRAAWRVIHMQDFWTIAREPEAFRVPWLNARNNLARSSFPFEFFRAPATEHRLMNGQESRRACTPNTHLWIGRAEPVDTGGGAVAAGLSAWP
jgi:hypothetical protein